MGRLISSRMELLAQGLASGLSQPDACRAAGLSDSPGNTSRMANLPGVQKRVQEILDKAAAKVGVTQERVIDELAKIGFANIADFIRVSDDGDPWLDFSSLDYDQAAAIVELTVEDFTEGRGENARNVRRVRFKMGDKKGSLEALAKILGMFKTKVEHSGTVQHTHDMTPDEARAIISRFVDRTKSETAH